MGTIKEMEHIDVSAMIPPHIAQLLLLVAAPRHGVKNRYEGESLGGSVIRTANLSSIASGVCCVCTRPFVVVCGAPEAGRCLAVYVVRALEVCIYVWR